MHLIIFIALFSFLSFLIIIISNWTIWTKYKAIKEAEVNLWEFFLPGFHDHHHQHHHRYKPLVQAVPQLWPIPTVGTTNWRVIYPTIHSQTRLCKKVLHVRKNEELLMSTSCQRNKYFSWWNMWCFLIFQTMNPFFCRWSD